MPHSRRWFYRSQRFFTSCVEHGLAREETRRRWVGEMIPHTLGGQSLQFAALLFAALQFAIPLAVCSLAVCSLSKESSLNPTPPARWCTVSSGLGCGRRLLGLASVSALFTGVAAESCPLLHTFWLQSISTATTSNTRAMWSCEVFSGSAVAWSVLVQWHGP